MLGGQGSKLVAGADYLLIVAVEEVHLESFHAQRGIVLHHVLGVVEQTAPRSPEDDAHPLTISIFDDGRNVDVGIQVGHQVFLSAPSFVDDYIFNIVLLGEVDIVAIGVGIDAGTEGNTRQVPVVPPVPGHFSGFNPRSVFQPEGRCQQLSDIGREQLGIVVCHQHNAPGQSLLRFKSGSIFGTLRGNEVQPVESAHFALERNGSKFSSQSVACAFLEEHAGIVVNASLHNHGFLSAGEAYGQGGDGQRVGKHCRKALFVVI